MNVVEAVREAWVREAEDALPDPPYGDFVSYEDWSRAFHLRERLTERLLAERLLEPRESVHQVPPMPAAVSDPTGAVAEAWRRFHGSPRPLRGRSARIAYRPRPSRPRPGSEDPSTWPENLL